MLNYAYKYICAVPVQTSDPHTSDSTNLRHTNVEQYKHQTTTNVGIVQTPDQYKCQTGTNVGLRKTNISFMDWSNKNPKELSSCQ